MVGDRLARAVSAQAPEVRITFRRVPATLIDDPAAQLAAVDGLFMPHGIISGLPAVELFRDRWLCAVAEDNPEVGESITLDQLAALPRATYQRVYDAPVTRAPAAASGCSTARSRRSPFRRRSGGTRCTPTTPATWAAETAGAVAARLVAPG